MAAIPALAYAPFHAVSNHMVARTMPMKAVTYPLNLSFAILQYAVEHFSSEFPTIAALNPLLVFIAIFVQTPAFYYCALKKTTGSKAQIWLSVALFFGGAIVFKGLELGFPKDTPEEQAAANLDPVHSYWHMFLHVFLLCNGFLATRNVPWSPKAETTPSSPKARTLKPSVVRLANEPPCSPKKAK